jgi:predicted HD superfamily hydrolase involved in NAD metabolism
MATTDTDQFEAMRKALQERVKPSRYRHSLGVSQTAEQLARIYGVDQRKAAVAGLLHDWDKGLSHKQLKKKAKKRTDVPKYVRKNMSGILHSFTAAATLRNEFPELTDDVLQAIERHTVGAPDMSDLDMVVYVADIIEPGRTFPDIDNLREMVGEVSLEELFYQTYKANLIYLIGADIAVYPKSLDTYNSLLAQREERIAAELAERDEERSEAEAAPAAGSPASVASVVSASHAVEPAAPDAAAPEAPAEPTTPAVAEAAASEVAATEPVAPAAADPAVPDATAGEAPAAPAAPTAAEMAKPAIATEPADVLVPPSTSTQGEQGAHAHTVKDIPIE